MSRLNVEAKVGFFVVLGIVLLAYMSTRIGKHEIRGDRGYEVFVYFDSVSGLSTDVPVEIAGVEVGRVSSIELVRDQAKVGLRLRRNIRVRKGAQALVRTKGILGDKYVELVPGSPDAELLGEGETIAQGVGSTDVDTVLKTMGEIAGDVREVTRALAAVMGGEDGRESLQSIISNIQEVTEVVKALVSERQQDLDAIIGNLADFSQTLKEIGTAGRGDIPRLLSSATEASVGLQEFLASLSELTEKLNQGKGSLGRLINDEATVNKLDQTLTSLHEISERINRGEGTVGRLIQDDETVERLNAALGGVNDLLEQQESFRTFIDYRGEYLTEENDVKSYISLRIQPKEDKYYLLQLVDDPRGRKRTTETVTTTDGATSFERKVETEKDELKFSAQIAKRYYDLGLRGGLFESTAGVALDYYLFSDRMTLSLEAFDFDKDKGAHLKFKADYSPLPHLHLTSGIDDFASDEGGRSFFLGAGIGFSDEDIKSLLTKIPIPTN